MGLFTPSYLKPGKGVDANEPEKKGFFRYFEVLREKFSKHLGLNLLCSVLSLPFLVILFFFASPEWIENAIPQADESAVVTLFLTFKFITASILYTFLGAGPISAVYAYIIRCYTNRTPVWIISDGKDKFIENFKQGMLVTVIDIIVLLLSTNALHFYGSLYAQTQNIMWAILTTLLGIVLVIFVWMHLYIYQIMVTFKLKFGDVMKNALLITLSLLPKNIFLTALIVGIAFVLFNTLTHIFALIVYLIIGTLFTRLVVEFNAARAHI